MGRLTFTIVEVRPLGTDYALVIGKFHLDRSSAAGGNSDGVFTLTFQKKQGRWKIIADHTS
jgi:ketosteroid isomerase-like protein